MSDREQLLHLVDRVRRGVALPAELDQLADEITELSQQLADADDELTEVRDHDDRTCEAVAARDRAEAAIDRVLSPAGIRAAADAITDEALTHLGRDLGTIHVERIAEAGLRAALNKPHTT
ncbi:hypothetical protein [Streptomyces sp. NPDC047985]|uniref:hypothetical protein n=1 Tax=Streptomyces sp. NPDC047985 TaxID=3155384 RepID=UPI003444AD55